MKSGAWCEWRLQGGSWESPLEDNVLSSAPELLPWPCGDYHQALTGVCHLLFTSLESEEDSTPATSLYTRKDVCCAERDLYLQVSGGCLIFLFEDSIVTLATITVVQMGNLISKGCLKEKRTQTAGYSTLS